MRPSKGFRPYLCINSSTAVNFSKGQLIFAACFVIVFIIGMLWAYRKDKRISSLHYKKVYLVLLFIGVVYVILFGIVKMRSHFF